MKKKKELDESHESVQERLSLLKTKYPQFIDYISTLPINTLASDDLALIISEYIQIGRFKTLDEFFSHEKIRGGFSYFETQNPSIPLEMLWQLYHELKIILKKHKISLSSGAIHTTSITNALSDISAGYHRPASHFPMDELTNTIAYCLKHPGIFDDHGNPVQSVLLDYREKHKDFVFYSSTSHSGGLKYRDYALGEIPVVFWTDKSRIAEIGHNQEAGTGMLVGEVRISGVVPVGIAQVIFTDLKQISQKDLRKLKSIAPVYDIKYLAAIKFIIGEASSIWGDCDEKAFYRNLFPHGDFTIPGYGRGPSAVNKFLERMTK